MKPKIYPPTIKGKEESFILDFLLNQEGKLKSAAVSAIPDNLKKEISLSAFNRGLENTSNLTECIYWIVHDLVDYPKKCVSCLGAIKKFHSFGMGYPHLRCSTKCSNSDNAVKLLKQKTSIKKYGTEFPWQNKNVLEKKSNKLHSLDKYIKSIYQGKVLTLVKDPIQLSIFLPDKNLAFDLYNLKDHSYDAKETREQKFAHPNKIKECKNLNIKLIQIFEHEWEEKPSIVENRIKSILGIDSRIYARQCDIKEVSPSESAAFLNQYHIQGTCRASVKLGLYKDNKLVALMTLASPRFSKKYEWEIIRYCSNTTVIGGASKLFNYFVKKYNPNTVVSYADARWSTGNLYSKLGFKFESISAPNYFYFKNNIRFARYAFQKAKLSKHLEIFDETKTEHDNVFANGYRRVWDSGNLIFIWSKGE